MAASCSSSFVAGVICSIFEVIERLFLVLFFLPPMENNRLKKPIVQAALNECRHKEREAVAKLQKQKRIQERRTYSKYTQTGRRDSVM